VSEPDGNYRANWRQLILPGSKRAYAFSTLCVAVATLLHSSIGLIVSPDTQVFTTFYPAVLFAALVGGAGAGIYAALLSGIIAWWAFLPPHFAFFPLTSEDAVSLLI
jgi:K+-sensing histidine kinase KdpD